MFQVFLDGLVYIYLIPFILITTSYLIIWRIHISRIKTAARQTLASKHKMRRELTMFRRIIIPLLILFISGSPYLIFSIHAQFISPSIGYAQRVAALIVAGD
jgi:hypothetical protein